MSQRSACGIAGLSTTPTPTLPQGGGTTSPLSSPLAARASLFLPPPWQRGLRSSSLPLGSEGFALPPSPLGEGRGGGSPSSQRVTRARHACCRALHDSKSE